jgi:dihydrofolate reductase
MTEFMKRIDAIFLGRRSYELLLRTESNPYPNKTNYVFSRTLKSVTENYKLVSGNIDQEITAIKKQPGKDIWLFGGAGLTASLLKANLVDEMMLAVHPILFGKGKPLFSDIGKRIVSKFVEAKTYSTGLVQLIYRL